MLFTVGPRNVLRCIVLNKNMKTFKDEQRRKERKRKKLEERVTKR